MKKYSIILLSLSIVLPVLTASPAALSADLTLLKSSTSSTVESFDQYVTTMKSESGILGDLARSYQSVRDEAHFPLFVGYLKEKARVEGFSPLLINNSFKNIHFVERVIRSDKNQLEKKITLDDYLKRVLTSAKVAEAQRLANTYKTALTTVSKQSGVPVEYIVSLWGMESHFGKIQGKEDIISALSTLAYEGRREAFFTKELIAALTILDRNYITVDRLKGSWAGAMGQCQFMPSSLLAYGKDGDNDGIIDIWQNKKDVFASIANYLATIGWQKELPWGTKVQIPASLKSSLAGLESAQAKTVKEWQQLGVKTVMNNPFAENEKVWLIIVDDDKKTFLVSENFKTLMHWNRSHYFGISVGTMADAIKAKRVTKSTTNKSIKKVNN